MSGKEQGHIEEEGTGTDSAKVLCFTCTGYSCNGAHKYNNGTDKDPTHISCKRIKKSGLIPVKNNCKKYNAEKISA